MLLLLVLNYFCILLIFSSFSNNCIFCCLPGPSWNAEYWYYFAFCHFTSSFIVFKFIVINSETLFILLHFCSSGLLSLYFVCHYLQRHAAARLLCRQAHQCASPAASPSESMTGLVWCVTCSRHVALRYIFILLFSVAGPSKTLDACCND